MNTTKQTITPSARIPELSSNTLRDLLNTIFYYRRLALSLFLGLCFVGAVVALIVPATYTARARLLTLSGSLYEIQPGNAISNAALMAPLSAVDVEEQLLESSELHRDTVTRELGPGATPQQLDIRLTEFEKHLKVSKLETGNVIEITYADRDAKKSAAALRTLLAAYFDVRAQVLTSGRVTFLTAERDKVRAELDTANSQIADYEREHGVVDPVAQTNAAVTLDSQLRERLTEARTAVADGQQSVDVLRRNASQVPREVELSRDTTETAHTVGSMATELFNLEAKRADLASRYLPTSPFVKQIDTQISQLKAALERQKNQVPAATHTGYNTYKDQAENQLATAQALLAGAQARKAVLEEQVAQSEQRLKQQVGVNDTLARLTAQRDLLAATAKDYSTQLEQARIQQNQAMTAGTTNVRVIESPTVPDRRTNSRFLLITAAIAAALLITLVVLIIMSSMRETFLSPEEAERALHMPVLCDLSDRNLTGRNAQRAFGRLIAAVDSASGTGPGKAILLLSAQEDGRSQAVATVLANALEPRSPGRVGLIHMEEGKEPPTDDTTWMTEPAPADSARQVGMSMTRNRMANLFQSMRSNFDYVVITAPPASPYFESLELTTVADLSVLVVEAEKTRKPVAETVLSQSSFIGGYIDGLVMTGRKFYIPGWAYRFILGRGASA